MAWPKEIGILGSDVFKQFLDVTDNLVCRDRRYREFLLLTFISAYTPDPQNLGVQAPTSEGKTYAALTVLSLFPKEDTWLLGGLSPTAIVHDYGVLVDEQGNEVETRLDGLIESLKMAREAGEKTELKRQAQEIRKGSYTQVNLGGKILVFLEDPHPDTWARLRPILSHDTPEVEYRFTDRAGKGPLRQQKVKIKGWPTVIFFRAEGGSLWEQLATRCLTISPEMSGEKYKQAVALKIKLKSLPQSVLDSILQTGEFDRAKEKALCIRTELLRLRDQAEKTYKTRPTNLFYFPFHQSLRFPSTRGRHMRDVSRFMALMQMHAAINLFARPRLIIDGVENIVVVRLDYERAFELFFQGEDTLEIFTGLPSKAIKFQREILEPLCRGEGKTAIPIPVSSMVKKTKEVWGQAIASDSIRKLYLAPLSALGFLDSEEDENDQRRRLWSVLREIGNAGNSERIQEFLSFDVEGLKEALRDDFAIKESNSVLIYDFDGAPLSVEDLFLHYYSASSIPLIGGTEKSGIEPKEPENHGNPTISGNLPQSEQASLPLSKEPEDAGGDTQ
jgi:hypothetical protein